MAFSKEKLRSDKIQYISTIVDKRFDERMWPVSKRCDGHVWPVSLEDILSTLHWKSIFYYVSTSGQFKAKEELDCIGDVVYWNLGEPLHKQNDLVVDFLTILLS